MFEHNYYNQISIWNSKPEPYQVQLLADILSLIPQDTQSILDVGCGNGIITNCLPKNIYVIGLDSSEEALKTVTRETKLGSITNLPFDDNSFDLVMASDVIEHLPDDIYQQSISELFRVSSKYVMVAVPHGELLEKSYTKCADCGFRYHINHHQRSLNEDDLINLCFPDWKVNEVRYSGDITRPPFDTRYASLLRTLEVSVKYDNCICPNCSSSKILANEFNKYKQILGSLRSKSLFDNASNWLNKHIDRSEIIALYRKNEIPRIISNNNLLKSEEVQKSPLLLELDNFFQEVRHGFVEGCFWTKYFDNLKIQNNIAKHEQHLTQDIITYFPVIPNVDDKILVKTSEIIESINKITLLAHDELNNCVIPLEFDSYVGNEIVFTIKQSWNVGLYGSGISLKSKSRAIVKTIQYIPSCRDFPNAMFVKLQSGHNILINTQLDYHRSWGLLTERDGYYPKPEWLWECDITSFYNFTSYISVNDFIDFIEKTLDNKDSRLEQFSNLLEEKEFQRSQAENTYSQILQEHHQLQQVHHQLQQVHHQLQQVHHQLQQEHHQLQQEHHQLQYFSNISEEKAKFATFFFQNAERRVSRILVLSHMFPHEVQSNAGCFIAEQVKALREILGLDVRVISCQPLWLNTKNPIKIIDKIKKYKKSLYSSNWTIWEDIPILRLPYLVGRPFFPFHIHGFTYQYAISKWASRIRKDFNCDLVHSHTSYLDGSAGSFLAKKYEVPLVITEHTGPFSILADKPVVSQVTANTLKSANKIISVSPSLENDVKKIIASSHYEKMICIPNGVNTQIFYLDQNNDKNHDYLMLLSVISLDENKNPFCLLEAFKLLHKQGLKIKLNIVGGGELEQQLQQWIENNNLTDLIKLLGIQPRHEVARLMREACDIFVLPSRSETFGVVVIEAMASGKPVVSTSCGGPESVITKPYLGELCENNNPVSLADMIQKVANNLKEYDQIMIRDFALQNYSFNVIVQKINHVYQNIEI